MAGNLGYDAPTAQQPQPPQGQYPRVQYPQDQYVQPPAAQAPRPQAEQQALHPLGIDPAIWPVIRQSAAWLARNQNAFIQQLHYDITRRSRTRPEPGPPTYGCSANGWCSRSCGSR